MIVLALFASAPASARSMKPLRFEALMTQLDGIDADLVRGMEVLAHATAGYDTDGKEAFLNLYFKLNCPPNRACPRYLPMPRLVKLKITQRTTDTCGSRVIRAVIDRRPVDGNYEELVIVDNQDNRCPHFARLAATEVTYRTKSARMSGELSETESKFEGDRLEPVFFERQ
jgi:hypothetical protein